MKKRKRLKTKNAVSEKSVIIEIRDKASKTKTLAKVQEIRSTDGKIVMDVKPLVYEATFEGDVVKLVIRENPEKFMEMIMKFESSEHEVLVVSGKRASVFSLKQFNRILESMLEKMVTKKYWQELHKELKEGLVV